MRLPTWLSSRLSHRRRRCRRRRPAALRRPGRQRPGAAGPDYRRVPAPRSTSSRPTRPSKWCSTSPGVPAANAAHPVHGGRRHRRRREGARAAARAEPSFHLVERDFGRFARAVRVHGAVRRRPGASATLARRRAAHRAAEDRRAPRPRPSPCRSPRTPAAMNTPLHRRHRRPPGPRLVRKGLPRARRPPQRRPRDRQRARTPPPASASPRTSASSCSRCGVDVMTSGNHIWDKKEVARLHRRSSRGCCARPTIPAGAPGRGALPRARRGDGVPVGVVNVMGRVFMPTSTTRSPSSLREIDAAAQPRTRRSSSSTSTPRPPPRRSRWAGISTARSPPSSARTRTCRPPTSASCRTAPPTSPTSA